MRMRIKLCGLSDEATLEIACALGVDAVGFVLAPSPRRVSLARARALLRLVPPGIERVAVLARASRSELEAALALDIDLLQAELDSDWPRLPAGIRALPVLRDGQALATRAASVPRPPHDGRSLAGTLVLDGPLGGGLGQPAQAQRAAALARTRPIVLAGGLTPENVAELGRRVRPFALDVSSGIEHEHGRKDPARMHAFVDAVRALQLESALQTPPENSLT